MKALFACTVGITVLLTGGITVRNLQSRQSNQDLAPFGRYNEAQIWEQADLLSQKLWPGTPQPAFHLERHTLTTTRTDGRPFAQQVWMVDCMGATERYLGKMEFDAQSGELLYVSLSGPEIPPGSGHSLSASDAIRISREWIRTVGIGGSAAPTSLRQCAFSSPNRPETSAYACVWKCRHGDVLVQVDQYTRRPAWIMKMTASHI